MESWRWRWFLVEFCLWNNPRNFLGFFPSFPFGREKISELICKVGNGTGRKLSGAGAGAREKLKSIKRGVASRPIDAATWHNEIWTLATAEKKYVCGYFGRRIANAWLVKACAILPTFYNLEWVEGRARLWCTAPSLNYNASGYTDFDYFPGPARPPPQRFAAPPAKIRPR